MDADSILFGPEKNHVIPILESVQDSLTDESRFYVGNRGQPPKLKRYIPQIVKAFRRTEVRNRLPRSISGLWKADLFLGGKNSDRWIGSTIKINPSYLQGFQGLRLGIYPKMNDRDSPRKDDALNLVRLPLPYDGAFMEVFYKSFFLIRAFLHADAKIPRPIDLPDAEDRYVTNELEARNEFPVLDVIDVLGRMSQPNLIGSSDLLEEITPAGSLRESGLGDAPTGNDISELVSVAPTSRSG